MADTITLAIDALASAAFIEGGVSIERTEEARERTDQRKRELIEAIADSHRQAVAAQAAPAAVGDMASLADIWEQSASDRVGNRDGAGEDYNQGVVEGMRICAADLRAALAATPALPATEDSSAGDLAETQAKPVLCYLKVGATIIPGGGYQVCFPKDLGAFPVYTAPQAQPADALDAETIKKAARYDWLRSGNDYQSDGPMVVLYESEGDRGDRPYWSIASDALDASIDAAMAAAQEGGNAAKEA